MIVVQHFKTQDGRLFESTIEAEKHERVLAEMARVNQMLRRATEPNGQFASGKGYIQHTEEQLKAWRVEVAKLIALAHEESWADLFLRNPLGIVGRYMDDSNSPLWPLMRRVYSIDKQNREWGQPYFGMNPNEGTQSEWMDTTGGDL